MAGNWRSRRDDPLIGAAIDILGEKFKTVDHYGPQQLAIFYDAANDDEIACTHGVRSSLFRSC